MKFYYLILLLIFMALSCSPVYYMPNTHNVPLLTQKDEGLVTVSANAQQVNLQGAYAVTDEFAIQVNASGLFNSDAGNNGHGGLGEVGIGYYRPIPNNLVFEVYGLAAYGFVHNNFPGTVQTYPLTTGKINASALRVGIQPAFGYKHAMYSFSLSTRIAYLNYNNIKGSLIYDAIDQVDYLQTNNSHLMFDPALTLRAGFEQVKLQLQLGTSVNLTHSDFKQETTYLTLGISYNWYRK